jgi:hypothetical protein
MEIARLQQVSNPGQLCMMRFNDKKRLLHTVLSRGLAIGRDRDHPSARLEYTPGSLQSFTADSVKYDIHFRDVVFKAHGVVVNDLFGTQLRYERKVACGRSGSHVCTTKPGELYREDANRTCSAMHQYVLSILESRAIEQPLPRCQRANRN